MAPLADTKSTGGPGLSQASLSHYKLGATLVIAVMTRSLNPPSLGS